MSEKILALAMEITGAEEKEQGLLKALCTAAEMAWRARLYEGVAIEDCSEAFLCAVAFSAAADFTVRQSASSVDSFTAGEISIKRQSGTGADQEALRKTAERLMAPYAAAEGFAFQGVQG